MPLAAESSQAGRIWLSSAALFDLTGMCAAVAQLVEQRIRNAKVASSIPASGTKKTMACRNAGHFFWAMAHDWPTYGPPCQGHFSQFTQFGPSREIDDVAYCSVAWYSNMSLSEQLRCLQSLSRMSISTRSAVS